jgi:hypothetical protein
MSNTATEFLLAKDQTKNVVSHVFEAPKLISA